VQYSLFKAVITIVSGELQNRSDEVYGLRAQLRTVEAEESNQRSAVEGARQQLAAITEQHSHALLQQNELQVVW
jgi:hypothetical protein